MAFGLRLNKWYENDNGEPRKIVAHHPHTGDRYVYRDNRGNWYTEGGWTAPGAPGSNLVREIEEPKTVRIKNVDTATKPTLIIGLNKWYRGRDSRIVQIVEFREDEQLCFRDSKGNKYNIYGQHEIMRDWDLVECVPDPNSQQLSAEPDAKYLTGEWEAYRQGKWVRVEAFGQRCLSNHSQGVYVAWDAKPDTLTHWWIFDPDKNIREVRPITPVQALREIKDVIDRWDTDKTGDAILEIINRALGQCEKVEQ